MGRWRTCTACRGRRMLDSFRRCEVCQGLGSLPPHNQFTERERRLAADHPHDPPHTGCPACVAEDPIGTIS